MNKGSSFSGHVARGLAWSSAISFGVKLFGTAITFVILKRLSLQEYGTYQLVLAAWGVLLTFLFSGIDQVLIAEGARARGAGDEHRAVELGASYFWFHTGVGVILWAIAFFGSTLLSRWYSGDILALLKILSWIFLIVPFQRLFHYHFSSTRDYFAMNAVNLLEEGLKGIGVLVAFYVFDLRIEGVLIAMLAAAMLSTLAFSFRVRTNYAAHIRRRPFRPFLALFYRQGGWIAGQQFVRQMEKNIRPFFIQYFLGRPAVALFGLAEKMYGHISSLVPVSSVLVPALAHDLNNRERLRRVLERGVKYTVPFYGAMALIALVLLPSFLHAFFPQYLQAMNLIYIVLTYVPFIGFAFLMTSVYVSHQEQKYLFQLVIIRFVLFCLLAPLLILSFGILGTAIEYVLSLFLYNVTRYVLMSYRHPDLAIRWKSLLRIDEYDVAVWGRLKAYVLKRLPLFAPKS